MTGCESQASNSRLVDSSALLECLSQLNTDIWAEVLLPKLVAQDSAGDVALACSQLRDMCFASVQRVDLSTLGDISDPMILEQRTQGLPAHFSNCTSAVLALQDMQSYHKASFLLPALAKLPKLNSIAMPVQGRLPQLAMATLLYSMRTQLTGLQTQELVLYQNWKQANQPWQELGRYTNLTSLMITFKDVEEPWLSTDLEPLSALCRLQRLDLCAPMANTRTDGHPSLTPQLLYGLTSLTSLFCDLSPVNTLPHVSTCTSLRELTVDCRDQQQAELDEEVWASLTPLSYLSVLELGNARLLTPSPALCAALEQLPRLKVLGAGSWSPAVLPALTVCTQLSSLKGPWRPGDVPEWIRLPQVLELGMVMGAVPFSAFPEVRTVHTAGLLTIDSLTSLVKHCSALQRLLASGDRHGRVHLETAPDLVATIPQRFKALAALSRLTNLTVLEHVVYSDLEVQALVQAARRLAPRRNLNSLKVWLCGPVSIAGAMQLAGLPPRLAHLQVEAMHPDVASALAFHASVFLCSLSSIRQLCIQIREASEVQAFLEAMQWVLDRALPRPGSVVCARYGAGIQWEAP